MTVISFLVQLKSPTRKKRSVWLSDQKEYASCVNWCVDQLQKKVKLSSSNVPHALKSAIKNEAIRRAKKAILDFKKGRAKRIPLFKSTLPIHINNQNWDTWFENDHWYIGFTTSAGKMYLPVMESEMVKSFFPFFEKKDSKKDINRSFRGTIQLLRKGSDWYVAIPVEISCQREKVSHLPLNVVGVDVGLRHIAVVSEPRSGKRQLFSGKQVGYVRRHFRSLRQTLGQKKALRAVKRIGQKEKRWITDYNRKLAKGIVEFALQFDRPAIKMERLESIRKTCRSLKRADRTIHSWSFYQLQQFILQKAARMGVLVLFIDPQYTSQRCFPCGHIEKANRSQDRFCCK
ncbi:MAG: RNA-guided endonuclease TnpB family protein, partial [Nitrososphaera sp.]